MSPVAGEWACCVLRERGSSQHPVVPIYWILNIFNIQCVYMQQSKQVPACVPASTTSAMGRLPQRPYKRCRRLAADAMRCCARPAHGGRLSMGLERRRPRAGPRAEWHDNDSRLPAVQCVSRW